MPLRLALCFLAQGLGALAQKSLSHIHTDLFQTSARGVGHEAGFPESDAAGTFPPALLEPDLLPLSVAFEGMDEEAAEETLLGLFVFDVDQEAVQTFRLKVL